MLEIIFNDIILILKNYVVCAQTTLSSLFPTYAGRCLNPDIWQVRERALQGQGPSVMLHHPSSGQNGSSHPSEPDTARYPMSHCNGCQRASPGSLFTDLIATKLSPASFSI